MTSVTDGEGNITQYTYDCNGNVINETDPDRNITTYQYDELNRKIATINALGYITTYTYRYDGQVETITDAMNNKYTKEYDSAGHLIKEILPNNDTTPIHMICSEESAQLQMQKGL